MLRLQVFIALQTLRVTASDGCLQDGSWEADWVDPDTRVWRRLLQQALRASEGLTMRRD